MRAVAHRLGDTVQTVLAIYAHVTGESDQRAADVLDLAITEASERIGQRYALPRL